MLLPGCNCCGGCNAPECRPALDGCQFAAEQSRWEVSVNYHQVPWTDYLPGPVKASCYDPAAVNPAVLFRIRPTLLGSNPDVGTEMYTDDNGCIQCRIYVWLDAIFQVSFPSGSSPSNEWFWWECKVYCNLPECTWLSLFAQFGQWQYGGSGYSGSPGSSGDCAADVADYLNALSLSGYVRTNTCEPNKSQCGCTYLCSDFPNVFQPVVRTDNADCPGGDCLPDSIAVELFPGFSWGGYGESSTSQLTGFSQADRNAVRQELSRTFVMSRICGDPTITMDLEGRPQTIFLKYRASAGPYCAILSLTYDQQYPFYTANGWNSFQSLLPPFNNRISGGWGCEWPSPYQGGSDALINVTLPSGRVLEQAFFTWEDCWHGLDATRGRQGFASSSWCGLTSWTSPFVDCTNRICHPTYYELSIRNQDGSHLLLTLGGSTVRFSW